MNAFARTNRLEALAGVAVPANWSLDTLGLGAPTQFHVQEISVKVIGPRPC
jgi:hypothetical protein